MTEREDNIRGIARDARGAAIDVLQLINYLENYDREGALRNAETLVGRVGEIFKRIRESDL